MPKIDLAAVEERVGSGYPAPYDREVAGRVRQRLGDAGGLTDFGVNLLRLPPGTWSSQRHWHAREDELVYVVECELVLVEDGGETVLRPGDVAAFRKGHPDGHHLINRSATMTAVVLEIGSRADGERVTYPDIDLQVVDRAYVHKDGKPY